MTLRRKSLTLAVALGAAALVLTVASGALAGQAVSVSGTYSVPFFGVPTCAPVGSSGLLRCDTTGLISDYSNDLTGTAVADFTELINCKTGRSTGTGVETFTGSVAGVGSGTLTWIDQFSSDFDCNNFFPFHLDINSVAVKGGGGLAGLQGKLSFTDTTYTGTLH